MKRSIKTWKKVKNHKLIKNLFLYQNFDALLGKKQLEATTIIVGKEKTHVVVEVY